MNTLHFILADSFEHKTLKTANGSPIRVRRNGQTKLWKTRPTEFKIPYKYGLYDHGYITQDNCHEWNPILSDAVKINLNIQP